MSKFLKSNLVGEYGELGDATLIPPKSEGGGSAEVTPASIVRATGQMTEEQAAQALDNLGGAQASGLPTFAAESGLSPDAFAPVELTDSVELVDGERWMYSGNTSEDSGWYRTNKIPVLAGHQYRLLNFPRYMYLYGESGTNGTTGTLDSKHETVYTVPEGVCYIGFYQQLPRNGSVRMWRLTPTAEETAALQKGQLRTPNLSLTLDNLKRQEVIETLAPLKGKVIVNLGDSVYGMFYAPEDVSSYLAEATGATVYNCAFGGTRMANHSNANYTLFSFHALAAAIASGDFSAQQAALASSWEAPEPYAARLELLSGIDFDEVDIVTVAFGTNDWSAGVDLDNAQNSKDVATYCGAWRYGVEQLLSVYPHLRIFACCPIFRTELDANNQPTAYSDTATNGDGLTIPQFCQALRDAAAAYSVPVIDTYYQTGFNPINRELYYRPNDGTHPSPAGRKVIARCVANGILTAGGGWGGPTVQPQEISDMASKTWVGQQGYLTLATLPTYNGGVR